MKLRAIFIVKKEKTMKELPKTYEPRDVEDRLYKFWVDNGYFHAERDPDKKPFTIVMPPPNVTGQLHMGHAMDAAMQDVLIRFKRMQGYSALWIPRRGPCRYCHADPRGGGAAQGGQDPL